MYKTLAKLRFIAPSRRIPFPSWSHADFPQFVRTCEQKERMIVQSSQSIKSPYAACHLLKNTGDQTGGHSAATLTDVEALTSLGSDWAVSLEDHLHVVTGHDHLGLVITGEAEISSLIWAIVS